MSFDIGGVVSSILNTRSAEGINAEQIHMMRENRAWADKETDEARAYDLNLANTSHQREMEDYKAAGLNPAMALSTGGADSPSTAPPGYNVPQLNVPTVALPDMMKYGVTAKQLEQADRQLDLQDKKITSDILSNNSDLLTDKMKRQLMQKGMIKADLEGEGAQIIQNVIKWLKKDMRSSNNPKPKNNIQLEAGESPSNFENIIDQQDEFNTDYRNRFP